MIFFITADMIYYEWYITKVVSMMNPYESDAIPITTYYINT